MRNEKNTKKTPRRRCAPRRVAAVANAPSARRATERWTSVLEAGRQLLMASLDLAEAAVAHEPEEWEKVRRVRALIEARCAGVTLPKVDTRDIAFTVGLVADLANSDFSQPGISALLVELLPLPRDVRRGAARPQGLPRSMPAICRLCHDEYQF